MVLKKFENFLFSLTITKTGDTFRVDDLHKQHGFESKTFECDTYVDALEKYSEILGEWAAASFQAHLENDGIQVSV